MIETMERGRREQGFVAIFSVLIIMGILTLLAIGFSNITRQAQRRALDDQLSTQAFYAAETGVNRALTLREAGQLIDKTDCTSEPNKYNYELEGASDVSISCLLVDTTPFDIAGTVPAIGTGEPFMSYFRSETGGPIAKLIISWDGISANAASRPTGFSGSNMVLTPTGSWDSGGIETIGVVRIDLVPVPSSTPGALTRSTTVTSGYTFFLYPSSNAAATTTLTIDPGTASQGISQIGRCNATPNATGLRCQSTVTLDGSASDAYYVRAISYYNATQLNIAPLDATNTPMEVSDSQAIVDSTGRAVDTSRRIQVRIRLEDNPGLHEPFSILSVNSLCKRFLAIPGSSTNDNPSGLSAEEQAVCNISSP